MSGIIRAALGGMVAAVAAAAALAAPAAGASVAAAPGVHRWLFDHNGASVSTLAEARRVARRVDLVIGGPAYEPFLAAMGDAHPGIALAHYENATSIGPGQMRTIGSEHPDWLVRGTDGQPCHSAAFGSYLIDPAVPAVRAWEASAAAATVAAGWNTLYLDQLGLWPLTGTFGCTPVDARSGLPYTPAGWLRATGALASAVRAAVGAPLIGNGLKDGTDYFQGGTRTLVRHLDMAIFETCFRGPADPAGAWPTVAAWSRQVRAIEDVQAQGRTALCLTKGWGLGDAALVDRWHRFARASFMLAQDGNALFSFIGAKDESPLTDWGASDPRIGAPAGPRAQAGGAWLRRFAHGIAVVNPGRTAVTVPLGGRFVDDAGRTVTRLALAAHAGELLTAA